MGWPRRSECRRGFFSFARGAREFGRSSVRAARCLRSPRRAPDAFGALPPSVPKSTTMVDRHRRRSGACVPAASPIPASKARIAAHARD
ncbi:hypothetical protein A8H32_25615 [Burkholderia thailandensis]|nr:hypothetical protein AQ475_22320 [Burkholderia thailandensis]AVR28298.1 hypothetical protein A8H32_25615 [Burkholderia thailandensis]